ncbi:[Protein-PII] uridylyltransferase / [Protein-PII]-UMP uridylyl-removing enzyme, partial [hydrothermal vent metagenome]
MSQLETTSGLLDDLQKLVRGSVDWQACRPRILARLKAARQNIHDHALEVLRDTNDGLLCAKTISDGHDRLLVAICQLVAEQIKGGWPTSISVLATGGYGRGELAPGSDLDLLFLVKTEALANENEWIERVLYLLWDMGLKIGPAVRTPAQCRKLAGEDHTIATSMMDLRVLFGSAKSGEALLKSLTKKQTANSKRQFIADKLAERDQRHQ